MIGWGDFREIADTRSSDPDQRIPTTQYVGEVINLCERLRRLRDEQEASIEIGFYNFSPSWQLFLNGDEGVVQPVIPRRHSQYNPLYLFQSTEFSLYVPFQRYFDTHWKQWTIHARQHQEFYKKHGIIT